ncbi:MAG: hypothetical protein H3C40_12385 [Ignavibacterium sp.]|nr:hypothetical protein [Ignavibacterium sp.]
MPMVSVLLLIYLAFLLLPGSLTNETISIANTSDTLTAQIDITILSGNEERYSKPFEKVRAGEKFRIHLKPYNKSYIWIINSSAEGTLIIVDSILQKGSYYIFPATNQSYIFDGKAEVEKIIIVLALTSESKEKIGNLKDKNLLAYLTELTKQSNSNIAEKGDDIINISGNLRDLGSNGNRLNKYSGINYLIKEFKFNVKR